MSSQGDFLRQWCIDAFGESETDSVVEDADGTLVAEKNKGRSVWLLPGTSGTKQLTPRKIEVNSGTSLFVVAASSHATPAEFKKVNQGNPSADELRSYADKISKEWKKVTVSYGTGSNAMKEEGMDKLAKASAYMQDLYINPGNYYAGDYGVQGKTEMAVVAYVKLFENLPKGTHIIKVDADADQHAGTNEKEYHLGVEYHVTVK